MSWHGKLIYLSEIQPFIYLLFKKLTLLMKSISGWTSITQSGTTSDFSICWSWVSGSRTTLSDDSLVSFKISSAVSEFPISAELLTNVGHSSRLYNKKLKKHKGSSGLSSDKGIFATFGTWGVKFVKSAPFSLLVICDIGSVRQHEKCWSLSSSTLICGE